MKQKVLLKIKETLKENGIFLSFVQLERVDISKINLISARFISKEDSAWLRENHYLHQYKTLCKMQSTSAGIAYKLFMLYGGPHHGRVLLITENLRGYLLATPKLKAIINVSVKRYLTTYGKGTRLIKFDDFAEVTWNSQQHLIPHLLNVLR